jgi:hypothetical protein
MTDRPAPTFVEVSEIVECLRSTVNRYDEGYPYELCIEAADMIERLYELLMLHRNGGLHD